MLKGRIGWISDGACVGVLRDKEVELVVFLRSGGLKSERVESG